MATCKLFSPLIKEIDNQVRIGNYLSRSEFIRYAIKSLEKNPFLIDTNIMFMDQLMSRILNGSAQEVKMENKVVSFKLPHKSANRLSSLSEEKQISRSEIIRLGITLLLMEEQTLHKT